MALFKEPQIWYRLNFGKIEAITVIGETDKQVILSDTRRSTGKPLRDAKATNWRLYCPTLQEAITKYLDQAAASVTQAELGISQAQIRLDAAKANLVKAHQKAAELSKNGVAPATDCITCGGYKFIPATGWGQGSDIPCPDCAVPTAGEPASPESFEEMSQRLHITLDEARALDAKAVK